MNILQSAISKHQSFLIVTHVVPDGDGIGSQAALLGYLEQIGKKAQALNAESIPEKYRMADPTKKIKVYHPGTPLPQFDILLVVDTHDWKMLGPLEIPLRQLKKQVLFIDHHETQLKNSNEHFIDSSSGSTGELVYRFLKEVGATITVDMAIALYIAIQSDAYTFQFQGTSADFHLTSAELLKSGVPSQSIFKALFACESTQKMRLFGEVLRDLKTTADGKIAWITVTKELLDEYGVTFEETASYVNHLTLLDKAEVALFFREEQTEEIKVSLRGVGGISVIEIAEQFGGGGHEHSAGMRIRLPLDEAQSQVLAAVRALVS